MQPVPSDRNSSIIVTMPGPVQARREHMRGRMVSPAMKTWKNSSPGRLAVAADAAARKARARRAAAT